MKKLMLFISAFVLLAACAGEERKPTEESLTAKEAFGVAEGLRKAYSEKNFGEMKKYATEEAYEMIARDIKRFQGVELAFTPRWVEIKKDGTVHLYVSWAGTWTVAGGKKERRGMALFELRGRPLRLADIIRANPFKEPEGNAESR